MGDRGFGKEGGAPRGDGAAGRGGERGDRGGRGGRDGDRGGRGGRGGDRGRKREVRTGRGGPIADIDSWQPVTKLGRLVKFGKITQLNDIFKFSIPVKESQIIDFFLQEKLEEEVMQIKPVQKQTQAGQRTRFKACVVIGDRDGHVGLGRKCAKEVQGAIKGAIIDAKLNLCPIRRGYWGNKIGKPHTVPCKVTGKGGSVRIRLIPAPRGTAIVGAPTPKKLLQLAGIQDCYTSSEGNTKTKGNTLIATFAALEKTYRFLTPDLWGKTNLTNVPFEEFSKLLSGKGGYEKNVE